MKKEAGNELLEMYKQENVHLLLWLLRKAYQHQVEIRLDELKSPSKPGGLWAPFFLM